MCTNCPSNDSTHDTQTTPDTALLIVLHKKDILNDSISLSSIKLSLKNKFSFFYNLNFKFELSKIIEDKRDYSV